jgi:hypothetical protein
MRKSRLGILFGALAALVVAAAVDRGVVLPHYGPRVWPAGSRPDAR